MLYLYRGSVLSLHTEDNSFLIIYFKKQAVHNKCFSQYMKMVNNTIIFSQVLQKLGKADETKDVAFEEGVINFNKQLVSVFQIVVLIIYNFFFQSSIRGFFGILPLVYDCVSL